MIDGLVFDEAAHRYTLHGVALPSVTEVIQSLDLGADLSMVPAAVLERKRQIGKAVHAACHYLDEDDLDEDTLDPAVAPYVDGYRAFREYLAARFEVVGREQPLACPHLGVAGTPDLWGILQGQCVVIDLKTLITVHVPSVSLQLAAYRYLITKIDPRWKLARRYALQLKPNRTFKLVPAELALAPTAFNAAVNAFHGRDGNGDRAVLTTWRQEYAKAA